MGEEKKKNKRILKGIVVSDKNDKTVVVRVDRVKVHPKYKKRFAVSKKYKVHDEKNEYKVGDKVTIAECRPYSRDKRWRAIGKYGQAFIPQEDVEDQELKKLDSAERVEEIEEEIEDGVEKENVDEATEERA